MRSKKLVLLISAAVVSTSALVSSISAFGADIISHNNLKDVSLNSSVTEGTGNCVINSVYANEKSIKASYTAKKSCTIIAAVYDKNQEKMEFSSITEAEAGEGSVNIKINKEISYYFVVKVFAVDSADFRPLCPVFVSYDNSLDDSSASDDNLNLSSSDYSNLVPNEEYVFYAFKEGKNLSSENLLYIDQKTADADGNISFKYILSEEWDCPELFIAGAERSDKINISDAEISVQELTFNGSEQIVAPTVILNGTVLQESVDYVLSGDTSVTNAGDYSVTVTGIGDYCGEMSSNFCVSKADMNNMKISLNKTSFTYTGKNIKPTVTVKCGENILSRDRDYLIRYTDNINAGVGSVIISGVGNCFGTARKVFKIIDPNAKDISNCIVSIPKTNYSYTGLAIKPKITVTDGDKTLENSVDYSVRYVDNVNTGTAYAVIAGRGDYIGSVKKEFTISNEITDISKCTIRLSKYKFQYTGAPIKPRVTVEYNGTVLAGVLDYNVRYVNNVNEGTATVVVAGKGNFSGTAVKTFKIVLPESENILKIKDIMNPVFEGSHVQIKLIGDSITMGALGKGVDDTDTNNDLIYKTNNRSYYENTAGHCWANSLRDCMAANYNCIVKNYGINGATSYAILSHIDDIVRDEDDICIVCIGINDRGSANSSQELLKTRLQGIYNAIISKGKKCILVSEIPVSETSENGKAFHSNDVDDIYQAVAEENHIEYISMYKLLNDYIQQNNIELSSLLSADGLHPNDDGYDVMYRLLAKELGVPEEAIISE